MQIASLFYFITVTSNNNSKVKYKYSNLWNNSSTTYSPSDYKKLAMYSVNQTDELPLNNAFKIEVSKVTYTVL